MKRHKYPKAIRDAWRIWKQDWRRRNPEKDKEITRRAIRRRRLRLLEERRSVKKHV